MTWHLRFGPKPVEELRKEVADAVAGAEAHTKAALASALAAIDGLIGAEHASVIVAGHEGQDPGQHVQVSVVREAASVSEGATASAAPAPTPELPTVAAEPALGPIVANPDPHVVSSEPAQPVEEAPAEPAPVADTAAAAEAPAEAEAAATSDTPAGEAK